MPLLGHLPRGHGLYIHIQRVDRWYARLNMLYQGDIQEHPEMALDQMLVFFIFCHQLKDGIRKETSIPNRAIEEYINQNACLTICADLANGVKHLGIGNGHDPRTGGDLRAREAYIITESGGVLPRPIITLDCVQFDIADLAAECIQKWNDFLQSHSQEIERVGSN